MIRLVIFAALPVQAASTRYRIYQYLPFLEQQGISCKFYSFVSTETYQGLYKRDKLLNTIWGLSKNMIRFGVNSINLTQADVVWIEREATPLGPPILEWLTNRCFRLPIIFDIDDALYLKRGSPVYGGWLNAVKFYDKTDRTIAWADHVICGNATIHQHVDQIRQGMQTSFVPTTVDTEIFKPCSRPPSINTTFTIGWIGSHSTAKFLEPILPVLQTLAKKHKFQLKIVGSGCEFDISGLDIKNVAWQLTREVEDFQSLDIGIYPLPHTESAAGKSGFKAIQYMAIGVPFVASPVGITTKIVEHGKTGFLAETLSEWLFYLDQLLSDAELRKKMGQQGRETAVKFYNTKTWSAEIAKIVYQVAGYHHP